jgi:EmrB/QacA subfamily drug resistance transporter
MLRESDAHGAFSHRVRRGVLPLTGAALFMVVLDNLIVASTLPSIRNSLHGSLDRLEWVLNAYILAFAVLMLTAAAIGERLGRRRVFTAGVVLFTAGSAAAALAPTLGTLIAARAVQGTGGAVIMPLTLTLLGAAYPPARRAAALGVWSAIAGGGVALGPIAGGLLTSALSWHWIFWVNVPVGVVTAVLAPRLLDESRGRREPLDPVGVVLVSAGLLAVVWTTVRANDAGWASMATLGGYAAGLGLLAGFVAWSARTPHAMVPMRLLGSAALRSASGAGLMLGLSMFAAFPMVVEFLSTVRGEGPVSSGVHTLFWTAVPMIGSPLGGRLGRRLGAARVMAAGLGTITVGLVGVAAVLSAGTPALALAPGLTLIGAGIALVMPNLAAAGLAAVAPEDMGKASGIVNTARQVGAVLGVAIGVAVFEAAGGPAAASAGVRAALLVAAGAAALGAGSAAAGRRREALAPVASPSRA